MRPLSICGLSVAFLLSCQHAVMVKRSEKTNEFCLTVVLASPCLQEIHKYLMVTLKTLLNQSSKRWAFRHKWIKVSLLAKALYLTLMINMVTCQNSNQICRISSLESKVKFYNSFKKCQNSIHISVSAPKKHLKVKYLMRLDANNMRSQVLKK